MKIEMFLCAAIVLCMVLGCKDPDETNKGGDTPIVGPTPNTAALEAKITEAENLKTTVLINTNANNVAQGEYWVIPEVMADFTKAIATAKNVLGAATTQDPIDSTVTALQTAIAAFTGARQDGAKTSNFTPEQLVTLVTQAKADKNGVKISANGDDVSPIEYWVTQAALHTFNDAITAAENAVGPSAVDAAYLALVAARNAFNASKKPGTSVNPSVRENPYTICNPVNISYQYQPDFSARESADPAAIVYRGDYYLFASHGSGYWWSSDLANWHFVRSTMAEITKWAPAACVVDDTLYLTHSQGGAIFKSTDPKADAWTRVSGPPVNGWEDPALFTDDDGRVYGYYGLSDNPFSPIYGVELDPANNMAVLQGPVELFYQHMAAHGFEVSGDNNDNDNNTCWMEGPWMTKSGGKYYLQYAVPGTGDAVYADGYYVADSPLGPFAFGENSPVTFKNTGFMRGAGHGSTVQDLNGAWWKFDTVALSVNHMFERRLVMVPANFDANGRFVTNMVFADYPLYAPHSGRGTFDKPGPDWNLLSLNKGGAASSTLGGHPLQNAFDENMRTWWSAQTGTGGEWLSADLGRVCAINAVQINFADQDITQVSSGRNHNFVYRYLLEFSLDGGTWFTAIDRSTAVAGPNTAKDTSHDYFEFDDTNGAPRARYLRLTNNGPIPAGGKFAVSGLRVFGTDNSPVPGAVTGITAVRLADERSINVNWNAGNPAAEGYIVVFGAKGSGLRLHHQAIGKTEARINALNMGVDYEFAVIPYGPGGVGSRSITVTAAATKPTPDRPEPPPPPPPPEIADGFKVYEAEDAVLGGGVSVSSAPEDAAASGGKTLHNMHNNGAFFEIRNVDGGPGGSATLRLAFSNGNPQARTEVFLNGASIGTFTLLNSGGWNIFKMMEFPISGLKPGETNTLRFNGGQEGFNPDFVQVIY